MEKCIMNEVFDGVFGGVVDTNEEVNLHDLHHSTYNKISYLKGRILQTVSMINARIFKLRSALNIPLQDRNDKEYLLNWCDMNYHNHNIRPLINQLYDLIDMKDNLLEIAWDQ
jgi:hypothetical protein